MNIGTRQQRRPERAAYDFFSWTFWNSGLRAQHDFAQAVNDYIEKRLRGEYGRLSRRPFLDLHQNGLLESIYAGLCSRTTCLRPLRLWPRTSVPPGPLRMEAAMKISADAEEALKEVERDANKLQCRELRQLIQERIQEQREAIKALRRFYN